MRKVVKTMHALPRWIWLIIIVLVFIVLVLALLYFFQHRLIFYPTSITEDEADMIRSQHPEAEEITVPVTDEVTVHGWLLSNVEEEPSPLLIYFGGNAQEVSQLIPETAEIEGWSVLLMNYRGYGLSEGDPDEEALLGDALMVYDEMAEREDIDTDHIVTMGRSIGSAVATHLSAERKVQGTILVSPFDEFLHVAQSQFPFLPVEWLLKYSFDSTDIAPQTEHPLLALIAGEDEIVDPAYSKALVEKWGGPKESYVIEGEGHNTIHLSEEYRARIQEFLQAMEEG
ncbi:alpha/beta hydrolase [Salicibibacter kimchii]|uniref:Alpha/beta hydrolase n=1 Tax=Salicibibacter kimchii TaxID=2099786 RepID=A0A345BW99_9BACI|nr:alpha/beta hydrolase [Salicibibacter kimchii]AXF55230.1 alpha/beta hydrolase [Salicibibacter kimchii]